MSSAADGETTDLIDPSTGEVFATARAVARRRHRRRVPVGRARVRGAGGDTTPSERQQALLKIADAIESRAQELVTIESENTGKPKELTMSEEIPPMVDQIRFFAGAARVLEGKSAGEYMRGFTSFIRREPVGICAAVTPWNYPAMMASGSGRPRSPPATHGAQAVRHHAGEQRLDGRGDGRVPARGRVQRRLRRPRHRRRARRATRRRRWSRSPAACAPAWRSPGRRPTTSSACTSSSAARRRSSCSTTPTSPRPPRTSRSRATSTPARTARRPRACSPARGCTTTSSPRSTSRPRARRPARRTTARSSTGR